MNLHEETKGEGAKCRSHQWEG